MTQVPATLTSPRGSMGEEAEVSLPSGRAHGEQDFRARGEISAAPLSAYPPEDQAFYRFWYGHMLNDLMQPPLASVTHATARYIWDAALTHAYADMPKGDKAGLFPEQLFSLCRCALCSNAGEATQ